MGYIYQEKVSKEQSRAVRSIDALEKEINKRMDGCMDG